MASFSQADMQEPQPMHRRGLIKSCRALPKPASVAVGWMALRRHTETQCKSWVHLSVITVYLRILKESRNLACDFGPEATSAAHTLLNHCKPRAKKSGSRNQAAVCNEDHRE